MFDSPEAAMEAGRGYVSNARDALDRNVTQEEHLYIWQNQVSALDEFLADSEELVQDGSDDLPELRAEAREAKTELESKIADFFDEEIDDSPDVAVPALLEVGAQIFDEAQEALQTDVESVEDLATWEDPLLAVKSWLADSEPYQDDKYVAAARQDLRKLKHELQGRIDEVVQAWKETDDVDE